jgi:hypothetical protein
MKGPNSVGSGKGFPRVLVRFVFYLLLAYCLRLRPKIEALSDASGAEQKIVGQKKKALSVGGCQG